MPAESLLPTWFGGNLSQVTGTVNHVVAIRATSTAGGEWLFLPDIQSVRNTNYHCSRSERLRDMELEVIPAVRRVVILKRKFGGEGLNFVKKTIMFLKLQLKLHQVREIPEMHFRDLEHRVIHHTIKKISSSSTTARIQGCRPLIQTWSRYCRTLRLSQSSSSCEKIVHRHGAILLIVRECNGF